MKAYKYSGNQTKSTKRNLIIQRISQWENGLLTRTEFEFWLTSASVRQASKNEFFDYEFQQWVTL